MARSYRDAAIAEQRRRVDLANRQHAATEALRQGDDLVRLGQAPAAYRPGSVKPRTAEHYAASTPAASPRATAVSTRGKGPTATVDVDAVRRYQRDQLTSQLNPDEIEALDNLLLEAEQWSSVSESTGQKRVTGRRHGMETTGPLTRAGMADVEAIDAREAEFARQRKAAADLRRAQARNQRGPV